MRLCAAMLAAFFGGTAVAQTLPDPDAVVAETLARFEDRCGMAIARPADYVASLAALPADARSWAANSADGAILYATVMRGAAREQVQAFALPDGMQVYCSTQSLNDDAVAAITNDEAARLAYNAAMSAALARNLAARPGVPVVSGDFEVDLLLPGPAAGMVSPETLFGFVMPLGGQTAFVTASLGSGLLTLSTHVEVRMP
jgi:2-hydroxychromene-2-carboxylate isomerase